MTTTTWSDGVAALDRLVLLGLADHLARHSRWGSSTAARDQERADVAGIAADLGAAPRFTWVVGRWVDELAAAGLDARPSRSELSTARAAMTHACDVLGYGPALGEMLLSSLRLLPDLLSGAVGVQAVLYPDGEASTAETAYRANEVNRQLNAAVADRVEALAARIDTGGGSLRVLELGAGIGALTADLLPVLARHHIAEYRFTDLSPMFLAGARTRFGEHAFLRTGLLDVDDLAADPEPPVDLVVAAVMAHNARNVDVLTAAVAARLRPGGLVLLIEPVLERPQSLTTMPFALTTADGAPVRTDVRAGTGRTYLTSEEWLAALARAGLHPEAPFPAPGDPLAAFSHCLFVATAGPSLPRGPR